MKTTTTKGNLNAEGAEAQRKGVKKATLVAGQMSPREVATLLFDKSITMDNIIWIAAISANPGDDSDGTLAHALEWDWSDAQTKELLGITQDQFEERFHGDFDELHAELISGGRTGFLVKAATPVPRYESHGGYSAGFGHVMTKWFYAEALDHAEFLSRLIDWRDGIHTAAKKEVK